MQQGNFNDHLTDWSLLLNEQNLTLNEKFLSYLRRAHKTLDLHPVTDTKALITFFGKLLLNDL